MKKHPVKQTTERRVSATLRIAMAVILLLLNIASVILLTVFLQVHAAIAFAVLEIIAIAVAVNIQSSPVSASYKLAWTLLVVALPVAGMVLYVLWGGNIQSKRLNLLPTPPPQSRESERRQSQLSQERLNRLLPNWRRAAQLLYRRDFLIYQDTRVTYFPTGRDFFDDAIARMEKAERFILLEYFILAEGRLWDRMLEVLTERARQGVEIRVLFDSMGCRSMRRSDWARMEKAGIKVAEFFPALLGKLQLRVNYRNHRKIVVIDGRIGFVGGLNVGREYLGKNKKFGYWRDTHICIEGSAVTSLAVRFVLDWNYAARENLFLEDRLFEIPTYVRGGRDPVQIISSGPDSSSQEIRDNYLRLIHMARKNIYIQTPYFIPDDDIRDALVIAAKSGIDVRIMIPCKPDHPFVYWATYSYIGEMIEAGARCYTYDNGFLHAKCMCVDGLVTCVGTANMDIRSFSLNFEVNAVVYSARTTEKLMEAFENDITRSTLVTRKKYEQRDLTVRIKEQFCRLLSPVL